MPDMSAQDRVKGVAGILLAAGRGARFDPGGGQDKLRQILPGGDQVAVAAAKNLLAVLPHVVAVVRPGSDTLAQALRSAGCEVAICPDAGEGMAASLVHALKHTHHAGAWLIALADMPWVRPETIRRLAEAVQGNVQIAAPMYQGRRGNPVAFGREHLERLLQLRGDEGARRLLSTFPVCEIATDDPGVLRDIDTLEDLHHAN